MFQSFGVEVLGLDLSENMVNIALDRAINEKLPSVRLTIASLIWLTSSPQFKMFAHGIVLCIRSSSRWPMPPGGRSQKVLST